MDELKELIKKELVVKEEITPEDVKFFKEFLRITEHGKVFVCATELMPPQLTCCFST
ncbi:MAG: hypothetical protein QXR26_06150 [Candidatus Caldarchaeum sp.]